MNRLFVLIGCFALIMGTVMTRSAHAQMFPPGTFAIDGFPMQCGSLPVLLDRTLPDMGMNTGSMIVLNPVAMAGLPTTLKLYIFGHECGHMFAGLDEAGADCWAVRTGRNQGWFPPQAFQDLIILLQNNPGSMRHPPGPVRVKNMWFCYNQP